MNQVFFLHIPKTGGGTLERAIRFRFGQVSERHSWTQNPGLPDIDFSPFDFISGHYPYTFAERLNNPVILTMFRDPVARVLSHWAYVHEFGYHHDPVYTKWAREAILEEWLSSPYSEHAASNLMTRFLCNRKDDDLDLAMENLESVDWIGFLDDPNGLQETSDQFLEYVDKDKVAVVGRYNATNHPVHLSLLASQTLWLIQEMNHKDIILYNRAREIMVERKAEFA